MSKFPYDITDPSAQENSIILCFLSQLFLVGARKVILLNSNVLLNLPPRFQPARTRTEF